MSSYPSYPNAGKTIRLGRIMNPADGRAAVVAFDHALHLGSISGLENPAETLGKLTQAGADAFLVSPGLARAFPQVFAGRGAPALILRLDWTNRWREEAMLGYAEGRTQLMASAEDAARLGADAVLTYIFFGAEEPGVEGQQVETVARLAQDCERLGIGCIIEPMPRGMLVGEDTYKPEYVAMGARIACELGADLLKTDYTGDVETFRQVVDATYRPILIAGGPKTPTQRDALEMVKGALAAGASGMFIGRNVFQFPDPARMMGVYRDMIHHDLSVDEAEARLQG